MGTMRKQKQLEALFMKILEQVRASMGQVTGGGEKLGISPQSQAASRVQIPMTRSCELRESFNPKCFIVLHPSKPQGESLFRI